MKQYSEMHPVNVLVKPLVYMTALGVVATLGTCNGRSQMLDEFVLKRIKCEKGLLVVPALPNMGAEKLAITVQIPAGSDICERLK